MKTQLFLTCEHASNAIPEEYHYLFESHHGLLQTHRGWDIGAFSLFEVIRETFPCLSLAASWSRVFI